MEKYKITVLGFSETKNKGSAEKTTDKSYSLLYSGTDKNNRTIEGVAIILEENYRGKVADWGPVNSRITRVNLEPEGKLLLLQIYASSQDTEEFEKVLFYTELQETVENATVCARHIAIMGDWNGRAGNEQGEGHVCGR